jgi:predicted dehydrogenase
MAFSDPEIDTVVIATPHDCHARLVRESLKSGKNVFVEKPLGLSLAELDDIEREYKTCARAGIMPRLMIGFNRRFAPHVVRMKSLLQGLQQPKTIVITVNAGSLASEHWAQDPSIGGGRIVGEACHFIDLLRFLIAAPTKSVSGLRTQDPQRPETISFSISFVDGSVGTVHYLTNGHKSFPKERVEVFCGGRILQLDNFRTLRGWGWRHCSRMKLWRQDKGAAAMISAFVSSIRQGKPSPIPAEEIFEVSRRAVEIAELPS